MLEDINTGINWVLRKIHEHGGNPNNIYLCGQSAGGHLAAVAMLTQARPWILLNASQAFLGGEDDLWRVAARQGPSLGSQKSTWIRWRLWSVLPS